MSDAPSARFLVEVSEFVFEYPTPLRSLVPGLDSHRTHVLDPLMFSDPYYCRMETVLLAHLLLVLLCVPELRWLLEEHDHREPALVHSESKSSPKSSSSRSI